jgi:hypothetical protein
LLEKLMGVGIDDVDDSSSPTMSSCGEEAVGVDDGEMISDVGRFMPAFDDAKFLNIAKIESALDTFGRYFLLLFLNEKSCNASSLLDKESLPWFDDVL